ncbi:MAG: NAD/NADP octopine/nopaline dehydrogenase family protein [Chloroflexota bacterium]|nr:MAG: NAD/NADP octopine/nopaline dehydrogenase family protein [Chloroflexota bacterium]
MQITICGGGNAAHTAAGLLSAREEHQVNVYISFEHEADRWRTGIASQGGIKVNREGDSILGVPGRISTDPAEVIPGSRLVLLALPAFAHESILKEIAAYIDNGSLVGALAARGCFDLCVMDVLGSKSEMITQFGLQTLPWACRIKEYGREVDILGTKAKVEFATCPPSQAVELASFLSSQLDVNLEPMESFLSLTLAGTGQIIHPGVMYGLFHDWDGQVFVEAPLFYQGIDAHTADILQRLSDEIQTLRYSLAERYPSIDLHAVRPLDEWLCLSYADEIEDTTSLQTYFVTNRSYAGLKVPVVSANGGLAPDFQARYLSEDVPFALLATRGIAELAGVPTPTIDQVLTWSQARLGKEYLVDGELTGKDLTSSRSPQRYGYQDLDSMIGAMFCQD